MSASNTDRLVALDAALRGRETVEQIECSDQMPNLSRIAVAARNKGYRGFMVIDQGGGKSPYVGAFFGDDGKPREHTFATHETPEAALVALSRS